MARLGGCGPLEPVDVVVALVEGLRDAGKARVLKGPP